MRIHRTLALGAAALALVMSACSPGGSGGSPSASAVAKPTVKVGSAGFWEAAVVGEMYAQALEAKGYTVERHLEIGERPAVLAALSSGQVNLVPEYLGGLAGQGLDVKTLSPDPAEALANMKDGLAAKSWVAYDYSPGTDADGFAVRKETADADHLATMSDLAKVADKLVWGIAPGCPDNPVCGPGLKSVYGIDISKLQVESLPPCSTDIASSLNDKAIDVAQVCTTQPEIETMNFVLLDDDKHLQPAQNLIPIAAKSLADATPSDFAETLNAIQAKLTTDALTQLGASINIKHEEIPAVATKFLKDNGLL
jgi:osmoprotectant transport system substrate-binding protein